MNTYNFTSSAKSFLIKGFIGGLILFAIGLATKWNDTSHSLNTQIIANVYTVVIYSFWVGVAAMFFLSATTLALGGWHIQIQKILLAIGGTLPFSVGLMIIFFAVFSHDLFHWTHASLYIEGSPDFDEVLASKHDYLNPTRFWAFAIVLLGTTLALYFMWKKNLTDMDENPSVKLFDKSRAIAAASIVIIAMGINTFGTWDWTMSIQPHWYSTMFTWYTLASASATMFCILYITVIYLKRNDYLPRVNENHWHNVGIYIFAASIFWTYLWFSQYMLIWYANIPEETIYFTKRMNGYSEIFYLNLILNFVIPFLTLIKRDAKRNYWTPIIIGSIIIVGHYFDFFTMIVPELVEGGGGFNLIGIGTFISISSIFVYISLNTLSKYTDLESSTHPYIRESYENQI
ncbi:MAG: hypothetical protein M9887_08015 [Chitinophagales bacterium]|nr:hypothetical protein [Chitinophagales bacterium]